MSILYTFPMTIEPRFIKAFEMLRERFGRDRDFTAEEAKEILSRDFVNVNEVLSRLRKAGLLKVFPDPEDNRRKIYRITRDSVFEEAGEISRDRLIALLKQGADIIRTRVDYRVLLLLLFYKAISDKYYAVVRKKRSEGYSERKAYLYANAEIIDMYDDKTRTLYTWHKTSHDLQSMVNAIRKLEDLNPNKLQGLSRLVDTTGLSTLYDIEDNRYILRQLIELFSRFDFTNVSYDILGDAYEWILSYFAPTKAKEGEVYTPIEVSRLLAHLLEPLPNETILDPASGSGSMLIEMYRYVKEKYSTEDLELIGQEASEINAILSRLNFVLHGIKNATIHTGDSLRSPRFDIADRATANPPWNQKGYDESVLKDNENYKQIFRYGFTNRDSADWAWIQLLTYYSKSKATIVLDTGSLTRGGKEKKIRSQFIEDDLIEAVILLPEKIFYNTSAPATIIVFNRNKPEERRGKILFINASGEYIRHPEVRKLNKLSEENIQKIADAYNKFQDIKDFSRVVPTEEIRQYDYNLNVPLYVFPEVEEEKIDLREELKKLEKLHGEYVERLNRVMEYVREIEKLEG